MRIVLSLASSILVFVVGFLCGDKWRSKKQMPPQHVHDFGPWKITYDEPVRLRNSSLSHGQCIEQRRVCGVCKFTQVNNQQWTLS
jgi:hypothetical protein